MRVCVIAHAVVGDAPGVVVVHAEDMGSGLACVRLRGCDVVVAPETIGEASSVTCLDVARVARGYGVLCVIVTAGGCDAPYGAACVRPGATLGDVVGLVRA